MSKACEVIRKNMHSINHIFEKLISYENLELAINISSLKKRERPYVKKVLDNIDYHIKQIQEKLSSGTFQINKHKATAINDVLSKKERIIIKPHYEYEQILHHAIIQVLEPFFMKGMYVWSCGSIPGRGTLYGKRYIEKFIKNNPAEIKYVLKADIKQFFQSIDTNILKEKFKKYIHDERMLEVLYMVIDANIATYDGEEKEFGVPIGFYTSHWFANWFLQDFDHYIKEQLHMKCYVRYIDDIVIFGRNKKELHKVLKLIREYLKDLNLELKDNYQVFRFDYTDRQGNIKGRAVDFMGFRFYRNRTTLRKSTMLKATRKARKIYKKGDKATWFDYCQMLAYLGAFKHTDTYAVFEKHIKPYVNIAKCKKIMSCRQHKINKEKDNATRMEKSRKPQCTS